MTFTADSGSEEYGGRFETRTLLVGIGFVVAGFVSAATAVRGD